MDCIFSPENEYVAIFKKEGEKNDITIHKLESREHVDNSHKVDIYDDTSSDNNASSHYKIYINDMSSGHDNKSHTHIVDDTKLDTSYKFYMLECISDKKLLTLIFRKYVKEHKSFRLGKQ